MRKNENKGKQQLIGYIRDEIYILSKYCEQLDEIIHRLDDEPITDVLNEFILTHRQTLDDVSNITASTRLNEIRCTILSSYRNIDFGPRIPFNKRFVDPRDRAGDVVPGKWVCIRWALGLSDPNIKSDQFARISNTNTRYQGGFVCNVLTMGVIAGIHHEGEFVYSYAVYMTHPETKKTVVMYPVFGGDFLTPNVNQRRWLLRHKVNRIRKHISRWREHLRYRPGSTGFAVARESFNRLAN